MTDDSELLRRYVEERSEAAFAELVRRHVDFVYAAAWRQVRDAPRAEDVAQSVFIDLARKAHLLCGHPMLIAWLYTSTRYAAAKNVRANQRRHAREQEAITMNEQLSPEPEADWNQLRPVLDDAMHELGDRDREAILLRFFKGMPFAEVACALRISEEAARQRVGRALDKLYALLSRRGITSTATALGTALATQTAVSAPAGLLATATGAALAAGASVATSSVTTSLLIMMKTTSTLVIAGLIALGVGSVVYELRKNEVLRRQISALRLENEQLTAHLSIDANQLKKALSELEASGRNSDEVSKLRALLAASSQRAASRPPNPSDPPLRTIEKLTNAGHATPDAAFETFYWAITSGDMKALASTVVYDPLGNEIIKKIFSNLPPDAQAFYGSPELMLAAVTASMPTTPVTRLEVVGVQQKGPDDAVLSYRRNNDSQVRTKPMRNSADGWMLVVEGTVLEKQSGRSEIASMAENLAASAKK